MTHFSPPVFLLWSILATLLQSFLLFHLWKFDRFRCILWDSGRHPGAFKRLMTYSYLATLPLLLIFSVSMSIIKYKEGYVAIAGLDGSTIILPKPYNLWSEPLRRLILPIYLVLSVAWSLEIVTHLEDLNFWIFLINQGPAPRLWFGSREYTSWLTGSALAVIGMPLICIFTRQNPLTCEAWVLLSGSIGSTLITLWFLYVLYHFPAFLRRIRAEGAEPAVIVRLTMFHEINIVRVGFRFMFTLPILTLALDGVQHGHEHPINENQLWTDLLGMLGGVGCMISSILTLLVFFPRSLSAEGGFKPDPIGPSHPTQPFGASETNKRHTDIFPSYASRSSYTSGYSRTEEALDVWNDRPDGHSYATSHFPSSPTLYFMYRDQVYPQQRIPLRRSTVSGYPTPSRMPLREDTPTNPIQLQHELISHPHTPDAPDDGRPARGSVSSALHPYISSYISPIDLVDPPARDSHGDSQTRV